MSIQKNLNFFTHLILTLLLFQRRLLHFIWKYIFKTLAFLLIVNAFSFTNEYLVIQFLEKKQWKKSYSLLRNLLDFTMHRKRIAAMWYIYWRRLVKNMASVVKSPRRNPSTKKSLYDYPPFPKQKATPPISSYYFNLSFIPSNSL